ncbi:MAG: alpha/beta fold hydrolase [Gammaproteobacteria bacterium]|nr:alpha/beta fold hydrolase [Gammaproteobacteria bacterium]MBQ0839714.1 alpha/beta fold hydrolase [Gammaproteobacteria bacterium]
MSKKMQVAIAGAAGHIEAVLEAGQADATFSGGDYVAVICHPHPLYGGTMDNKVVTTLARVYRELGITSLRFNFRGVGASEGEHDEARGEVDDLCRVSEWLLAQYPGSQLLLAGFSFGSAIVAAASERLAVAQMILIAPPVMRYSYAPTGVFTCPVIAVLGEQDELVETASVLPWLESLDSPVSTMVIPEASHFFHGQLNTLREKLGAALSRSLGAL